MKSPLPSVHGEPIAILGIGCRFPGGADDPDVLWQLLLDGVDAVTEVPEDRYRIDALYDPDFRAAGRIHQRHGGFVRDIDKLDADMFGLSPREASRVDPQQRLLLETVVHAAEHAGVPLRMLAQEPTGVFVGISTHDYSDIQLSAGERTNIDAYTSQGGSSAVAANRISYVFDLRGPSLAIDTACSSTLYALHFAVASLRQGDCAYALVGGVNAILKPETSIGLSKGGFLSPTGRCQAFGAGADGFVRAEGAGMLLLRPLAAALRDRNRVLATIVSTFVNEDGRSDGMASPQIDAQVAMLRDAYARAGINPRDVAYVEAHGTGTQRGDFAEATAMGAVLGRGRDPARPLLVGSIKTNLGHLEAGAGAAGLAKLALALRHRTLPPSLHSRQLSPAIPFRDLSLEVVQAVRPLKASGTRLLCGINSFGFGGANAHAILEAPPDVPASPGSAEPLDVPAVLVLSAKSEAALHALTKRYEERLGQGALRDIAWSSIHTRDHHRHRIAIVARTGQSAAAALSTWRDRRASEGSTVSGLGPAEMPLPVGFVCSGQGPQWWGMGRRLLAEDAVFREAVEEVSALVARHARLSLMDELRADESASRIDRTDVAQPALFALQIGLACRWASLGIVPGHVVGHSVGEIAAAVIGGALSLEQGAEIAVHRSRIQQRADGAGAMIAVGVGEEEALALVAPYRGKVSVAAVNGPALVTLAGDSEPVGAIQQRCEAQGLFCRRLRVRVPFHSHHMDPLEADLRSALGHIVAGSAKLPLYSTVSGALAEPGCFGGGYWFPNVRDPVRFVHAIRAMIAADCTTFIELSPHPSLAGGIVDALREAGREGLVLPSLRRPSGSSPAADADDAAVLLGSLARLYVAGHAIASPVQGAFAELPLYPFQRTSYWVERDQTRTERLGLRPHPYIRAHHRSAIEPDTHLFDIELDVAAERSLDDHRLQGMLVFPGAGHLDLLAGCARAAFGEGTFLRDVRFEKALVLPEPPQSIDVRIEMLGDAGTFRTSSRATGAGSDTPWTRHVSGRVDHHGTPLAERPLDLGAVRQRCATAVDMGPIYQAVSDLGLDLGPTFRGVRAIHAAKRPGSYAEAIARIEVPAELRARAALHYAHAAVLDACLQAAMGAVFVATSGEARVYVPYAIGTARLRRAFPPVVESIAHVKEASAERLWGDLWIVDERGEIVAELYDFEGRRVEEQRKADVTVARTLVPRFEPLDRPDQWAHRNAAGRVRPVASVAEALEAARRAQAASSEHRRYYGGFGRELDHLAHLYVARAFAALGIHRTNASAAASHHARFIAHWLDRLERAGLTRDAHAASSEAPDVLLQDLALRYPDLRHETHLLGRSGRALPDVLRGEANAVEVLFGSDAWASMVAYYREGFTQRSGNVVAADVVAALTDGCDPLRTLRILEIGAGTGGLTSQVLPRLRPEGTTYTFTDVSPMFFSKARESFTRHPFVEYRALDIESPPEAQGFAAGSADIVLASNVLHATRNLRRTLAHARRLLADGGALVLVEITEAPAWIELVFGMTEGWWLYEDSDLRSGPTIDALAWTRLLEESGFADIATATGASDTDKGGRLHVLVARAAGGAAAPGIASAAAPERQRFLITADRRGHAQALAAELSRRGHETATMAAADAVDELARGTAPDAIVHLGALDGPDNADMNAASLRRLYEDVLVPPVRLVEALSARARAGDDGMPAPRAILVTAGAHAVNPGPAASGESIRMAGAALWGVGRVLANERAEIPVALVDLPAEPAAGDIAALAEECAARSDDRDVILRGGARLVAAAVPEDIADHTATIAAVPGIDAFRLVSRGRGLVENLVLRACDRPDPGPFDVEIEVHAAGLNFRDAMLCLGLLTREMTFCGYLGDGYGLEGAGVVTRVGPGVTRLRPGDRVAMSCPRSIASFAVVPEAFVIRIPAAMSFAEAASIPACMTTAHAALCGHARIDRGETVLIHSAAGGVGHAALQIARWRGARVFATAGTPEKRAYLRSLGVELVMSSRSLDFANEVLAATGGRGADVILNSLAGKAIERSLACLAPHGRFIEIGKQDIYDDVRVGLRALRRNASYSVLDLDGLMAERKDAVAAILRDIERLLFEGTLQPLPVTTFPLSGVHAAFRWLIRSEHIGKAVVAWSPDERVPIEPRRDEKPLVRPDRTYAVTGGTSGFGLEIARWLAGEGARHLILLSRSGADRDEVRTALDAWRAEGIDARAMAADVADRAALDTALCAVRASMPPLAGIFHAAMVLSDAPLSRMSWGAFETALRPKAGGALNLDDLTRTDPIEHFVLISSLSYIYGNPGQASYNAANALLESLASARRARSLPATVVHLGVLGDTGYVARNRSVASDLETIGFHPIRAHAAIQAIERMLRDGTREAIVAAADWSKVFQVAPTPAVARRFSSRAVPLLAGDTGTQKAASFRDRLGALPAAERLSAVTTMLRAALASILDAAPEAVSLDTPLKQLGLDSLMASQLSHRIKAELGMDVPMMQLLNGPSLETLADALADRLGPSPDEPAPAAPANWLVPATRRPDARLRLFCLPFLGAGAPATYAHWLDHLPPDIDVAAVQLPGFDDRADEAPFHAMAPLVRALVQALAPSLDVPFVLFGHSLGALTAFELAHALRDRFGRSPEHLFLSGMGAPYTRNRFLELGELPRDLPEPGSPPLSLASLDALPRAAHQDPVLARRIWAAIRAGLLIGQAYRPAADRPLLDCPITAVCGTRDTHWPREVVAGWARYTRGTTTLVEVDGGHLFVRDDPRRMAHIVLRALGLAPPKRTW